MYDKILIAMKFRRLKHMVKSFWRKFCISDKAQREYYNYIDKIFSKYSEKELQLEYTLSSLYFKPLTMLSTTLIFIITVLIKIDVVILIYQDCITFLLLFLTLLVVCMIISAHNQAMIRKNIAEKYLKEKSKIIK